MTELSPAEAVYFAAVALPAADRHAYLARACAGRDDLRLQVERMLAAKSEIGDFLEPAPARTGTHTSDASEPDPTADYPGRHEHVGTMIAGKYKLLEAIGEGGMGSVYMAQQTEPVKRVVAVKVIKAGMDSKAVLARFEAERQALAMMDHPNIAKVLDAGTTENGRPFFVMELVKGVPITKYCDDRKLTPQQRLDLFIPVCNAIQHAHLKGVIHRDIKPSNVLIALYDDRPVPKVIDFGVAKATGAQLTDHTLVTGYGAVVGTPEYMSPEQASLNNLDVDTRSDVYSLGVLLYELLTGSTPVDRQSLGKAALIEILRIVREVEAPRPSAKLSTSQALPSISANRGIEPKKLTVLMRNELDWIVMKALEKDRARRYETASGFAADVQRYLAGEPVQAHPPTASYRFRKFIKRNRTAIRVVSAFVCMGLGAIAMGAYLAVQSMRAERVAAEKQKEAEANAMEAQQNLGYAVNATTNAMLALAMSDINTLSLQVDLDLAELRSDPSNGLLRLARPMKTKSDPIQAPFMGSEATVGTMELSNFREYRLLREFVTAAVLTSGQHYAPLLPPMTHAGQQNLLDIQSPDGTSLLTLSEDGIPRLWDIRTATQKQLFHEGNERAVNMGFSPDGKTVFTSDRDSIVRFWNACDGKLKAKTGLRNDRYPYPDKWPLSWCIHVAARTNRLQLTNTRALVQSHHLQKTNESNIWSNLRFELASIPELYDIANGRRVARLDRIGHQLKDYRLSTDERWITAIEDDNTIIAFSATDGNVVGMVREKTPISSARISKNGRWIITDTSTRYHLWSTETWQEVHDPFFADLDRSWVLHFLTDDIVHATWADAGGGWGSTLYRIGETGTQTTGHAFSLSAQCGGEYFLTDSNQLIDGRSLQRIRPSAGRKYPDLFARLSPDKRFVFTGHSGCEYIDVLTDKTFVAHDGRDVDDNYDDWSFPGSQPAWIPKFGYLATHNSQTRILPAVELLNIPPAMLELWAQVAVRGELGSEGEFVPWNEATWENKRQQLAAMPVPYPDFPFPGYVATDKLHWLRAEYAASKTVVDSIKIAREILRRCDLDGNTHEAVRWRAELAKLIPEVAPSPRLAQP